MSERNPISFRIPSAHHHELLEQLTLQFGEPSPSSMARRILVQHLEQTSPDSPTERLVALETEIAQLRREIGELRKDLSLATATLLAHAGKRSEEEAVAWTNENLKSD